MRIAILSSDYSVNSHREKHNLIGGIGYYRLYRPYEELLRQYKGIKIDFYNRELPDLEKKDKSGRFLEKFVEKYDIIITKAIDNGPAASMLGFLCEHFKTKLVIDLDDNYFEVTPDQPAYKHYFPGSEKRAIFSAYLSLADAIICSTEPLKRYYQKRLKEVFNKETPIYLLPNYNRKEDWPNKLAKKDKLTIGWAGSTTHDADLELVAPAINKLMEEYPELHFEMVGGITTETAPKILSYFNSQCLDRVAITGGTLAWEGYTELMAKKKWHIGIAPLVNNEFTRGKSHIKWMEYAMLKIPTVASKVYPYEKNITEETGLLAIDGLEFYKHLKTLINNKDLREQIGNNAYNYVCSNLQWSQNIKNLNDIINEIYGL